MSDTPRTDEFDSKSWKDKSCGWREREIEVEDALNFARQLERELNDLKQSVLDLPQCPNCQMLLKERDQLRDKLETIKARNVMKAIATFCDGSIATAIEDELATDESDPPNE